MLFLLSGLSLEETNTVIATAYNNRKVFFKPFFKYLFASPAAAVQMIQEDIQKVAVMLVFIGQRIAPLLQSYGALPVEYYDRLKE